MLEQIFGSMVLVGMLGIICFLIFQSVRRSTLGPSEDEVIDSLQQELDSMQGNSLRRYITFPLFFSAFIFALVFGKGFLSEPLTFIQRISNEIGFVALTCGFPGFFFGSFVAYHYNIYVNRNLIREKIRFSNHLEDRKAAALKLVAANAS